MTDRIDENPPMSIPEQAAEWLLRWHCGDLSIAERFEYLTWLKTSPVHIAETLRMCRLYSWLEATKLKLFVTNEDNFSNVVELPPLRERAASGTNGAGWQSLWKVRIAAGAAAIGLSALLALGAKVAWFDHTMRTQASEWRSIQLADGSSVSAAPYTRIHHDIGDEERLITLEQGSAVFRVAKDASRPFLVDTGIVVVKATGTEFGVERHGGTVTITVSEGSVAVLSGQSGTAEFASVPLGIDEQLTISGERQPEFAKVEDGKEYLEWGRGVLHFKSGNEIRHAVERFNRSNEVKIVVDKVTGERQIRGVFELNDPETFAAVLEDLTGASLVREGPDRLSIKPREPNH
jgi:transmembrane sensor